MEAHSAVFSEKRKILNKITLVDDNYTIVSDDQSISEELNNFFKNASKSLNIQQNSYLTDDANETKDQVKKAIFKYKNHPSIILIKNKITVPELFAFTEASVSDIEKELSNLNTTKASTFKLLIQVLFLKKMAHKNQRITVFCW